MKKFVKLYSLFLMSVFHTSCAQNQTIVPQNNNSKANYSESQVKEAATSKVPMSIVWNVKKARNVDILIASYLGVFSSDASPNDGVGQGKSQLSGQASFHHFTTKDEVCFVQVGFDKQTSTNSIGLRFQADGMLILQQCQPLFVSNDYI